MLPAGATIVAAIAELMQPAGIEVARSGLRAGMLLEALAAVNEGGAEACVAS